MFTLAIFHKNPQLFSLTIYNHLKNICQKTSVICDGLSNGDVPLSTLCHFSTGKIRKRWSQWSQQRCIARIVTNVKILVEGPSNGRQNYK